MFPFASILLLSLIVFLPTAGGLVVLLLPRGSDKMAKRISLAVTAVVFVLTVWLAIPAGSDVAAPREAYEAWPTTRFVLGAGQMQQAFRLEWISSFGIFYSLGIDGISLPLVLLTSLLSLLAMAASWPIEKHVKAYCALFLLLETGMLGVFMALDFFLFYVFWEVMLLPMYFLIGIWGGPRREYAAIKFFLFTLAGGVLMLVAMLMLYFNSDLRVIGQAPASGPAVHTFDLLALAKIGQAADSPFGRELLWGKSVGWWAFLLLLVGFLIKVPSVPLHTWLPDAHVEAPTPISMLLAGVLLKMGGYGMLRICYPICPEAAYELAWLVSTLGVVSMVYGALAALAQSDFKRLVAYSSVSHMGYVVLGLGAWTISAAGDYSGDNWKMGMNGALFQMVANGLTSAGMFFAVGVIYQRVKHRDLDRMGGLLARMPVYGGLAMLIFFAAMGLPGLSGFVGEVFVLLSAWNYSMPLAVAAASVMILTAGYILWAIQRVYLGPEYRGPHAEGLVPLGRREFAIAAPLVALAVVLGVYPQALLNYTAPSVNHTVDGFAEWMENIEQPRREAATKEAEIRAQGSGTGKPNSGRWHQVLGDAMGTTGGRKQYCVSSTCCSVFSTRYPVPSTQYPVPCTRYSVLITNASIPSTLAPPTHREPLRP